VPPSHSLVAQLRRVWHLSGRWLPQGWFDAIRQLVLFAGAYYVYRIVRGIVDGHAVAAFSNARDIVNAERGMHLFFEPNLQDWALHKAPALVTASDWMYVNSHFVVTTTFLIWLYVFRNHAFYFVRNMFLIAMAFALVGYLVYPAAPPRYLPEWGFQDTVSDLFGHASDAASVLYNPYAAMPSMHVAFALMIAVPAIQLTRHAALKLLWALYPLLVTFVVISTANHFWLDAAVGALVAALSAVLASTAFARFRPEAWSWRTRPAEARA
jgi:membrane-associated phospholipid phosphatase